VYARRCAHQRYILETQNTEQQRTNGNGIDQQLTAGLGWFSVGLGLWETVAPGVLGKFIGIEDTRANRNILRFYGMREMAAGIGLLSGANPQNWLWARVAGDALDLASLGKSLSSDTSSKGKLTAAAVAVAGVTALDIYCGTRTTQKTDSSRQPIQVNQSIIIDRPPEELYRYWRDLENLPSFMDHLKSVRASGERRSHWTAKGPAGTTVEWDAEIVDDQPNTLIAWRSLPGAGVDNSGTVRFDRAPGDRGTIVRVQLNYTPPGGAFTAKIGKMFGAGPEAQLESSLRAFKQIMEVGEVTRSDSSIHPGMHAARPPAESEAELLKEADHKGSANLQPSLAGA
jgi:uncharacterized membrane protein